MYDKIELKRYSHSHLLFLKFAPNAPRMEYEEISYSYCSYRINIDTLIHKSIRMLE